MSADRYQILTADATRSSILVIDKLSYTDEGTYSCVVNHATQTDNSSRNIVLELMSKLICKVMLHYKYRLVLFTAAVEAAVNQFSLVVGRDGTLSCEMYGYLRGTIEWLKDGQQLQSVGRYNITTSAGSREGQNGEQSSVSSVVSQLTIQQVQEGDEGTYTCRVATVYSNITLQLIPVSSILPGQC